MEDPQQLSDFFRNIQELTYAYLQQVSHVVHLARLEAQAIYRTLWFLFGLLFVLAALLTGVVFCIFSFLFLLLIASHLSWLSAAGITTLAACVVFILGCFILIQIKKKLFFPVTRKHFSTLVPYRKTVHEQTSTQN